MNCGYLAFSNMDYFEADKEDWCRDEDLINLLKFPYLIEEGHFALKIWVTCIPISTSGFMENQNFFIVNRQVKI